MPPLVVALGQVRHRVDEAERGGAVARVEIARDDRARPAADAGEHGDVLLAVRAAVGDRLADDPRAGLELPEQRRRLARRRALNQPSIVP